MDTIYDLRICQRDRRILTIFLQSDMVAVSDKSLSIAINGVPFRMHHRLGAVSAILKTPSTGTW